MIDPDRRNAIYQLHLAGTPQCKISRQFHVSPRTVRTIVRQQGAMPQTVRKDKIHIDPELLRRLYQQCDGWLQRVHEKLVEEEGIQVSYPTLTRLVRELELGKSPKARCDHVPDEPGAEMQHDTTVYQVKLSGKPTRVIASLLYLRYSKRRYLKFYRVFNRFAMKCFLHEALMFWGCALQTPGLQRHRFLRELLALSRKVTPAVFVEALTRALRYRVVQMETLQRIAWFCMSQGQEPLPSADVDESFRQRPAYQEGFLTDEPDLSVYDETPREDNADDEPESEDHDG